MQQTNEIVHLIPDDTLGEFYYDTMKKTLIEQIRPSYLSILETLRNVKAVDSNEDDCYFIQRILDRSVNITSLLDNTIEFLDTHKFNKIKDSQIQKALKEDKISMSIFSIFEEFSTNCKEQISYLLNQEQISKLNKIIDICYSWNKIPFILFTEEGSKETPVHDCINCFTGDTLKEINQKLETLCEEMF